MSTELDALMLANALEVSDKHPELINVNNRAAAKLRRLHAEAEELRGALDEAMWHVKYKELKAVNEELLVALKNLEKEFRQVYPIYYYAEPWGHETNAPLQAARAAIAKAGGAA